MRIVEIVQEVIEAGLVVALEHQRQRERLGFDGDVRRNNGRLLQCGGARGLGGGTSQAETRLKDWCSRLL